MLCITSMFGLADLEGRFTLGIDGFERGEIGAFMSMVTVPGTPF